MTGISAPFLGGVGRQGGLGGLEDRLGFHHHAMAAAELVVVGGSVGVVGVVADVGGLNGDLAALHSTGDDAELKGLGEGLREQGQDVVAHGHWRLPT